MRYSDSLGVAELLGYVNNAREESAFKRGWNSAKEVEDKVINTDKPYKFTMVDALIVDQRCAKLFKVALSDLYIKNRKQEVVDARNLAMFIMRYRYRLEGVNPYYREGNGEPEHKLRLYSTPKIAKYFYKDHSSVQHSLNQVKLRMEYEPSYRTKVADVFLELIPGYSTYSEFMTYIDSCALFINSKI